MCGLGVAFFLSNPYLKIIKNSTIFLRIISFASRKTASDAQSHVLPQGNVLRSCENIENFVVRKKSKKRRRLGKVNVASRSRSRWLGGGLGFDLFASRDIFSFLSLKKRLKKTALKKTF